MVIEVDDFLEHHGVRGQHWGIRNKRSGGVAKAKSPHSEDSKVAGELRSKPVHTLSNVQLKTVNERLNLEQNYSRMNPNKVASGKRKAEAVLGTLGVAVTAYNLFNSPAGKALMSLGKKTAKQGQLFKP